MNYKVQDIRDIIIREFICKLLDWMLLLGKYLKWIVFKKASSNIKRHNGTSPFNCTICPLISCQIKVNNLIIRYIEHYWNTLTFQNPIDRYVKLIMALRNINDDYSCKWNIVSKWVFQNLKLETPSSIHFPA